MPHDMEPIDPPLPEAVEPLDAEEIERRTKKKLPRKEFENLLDQRDYLLWPGEEEK